MKRKEERFSIFVTRLRKFITERHRLLAAFLFLAAIPIFFITALVRDFESKQSQWLLGCLPAARVNYVLTFTSIDANNETANGTLRFDKGLKIWEDREIKISYGKLIYADLTDFFVFFTKDTNSIFSLQMLSARLESSYTRSKPRSRNVSIKMFGNPEIYPFDNYLIVGAVGCPAYLDTGEKKIDIADLQDGESLSISNFIPGMFMRKASKGELSKAISTPWGKAQVVTEEEAKELNNCKNRFALIIERPIFLRFLTIILGLIALGSAVYIGGAARFDAIPLQIAGYVFALWGIRNIIMSEVKSFPSLIDYVMLFMYLIIFTGMIFRIIAGRRKGGRKLKKG